MAPANAQIVTAYEECGLSPEEIAREFSYDIGAVKYALMTCSSKFVDQCGFKSGESDSNQLPAPTGLTSEDKPLFDTNDLNEARGVMRELMVSSEIDMVRLKAATFVIDEAKGRNDIKALKSTGLNITIVSEAMVRARAMMANTKKRAIEMKNVTPEAIAA